MVCQHERLTKLRRLATTDKRADGIPRPFTEEQRWGRLARSDKPYLTEELGLEIPRITNVTFRPNEAYVLMPIVGQESASRYEIIKDACTSLGLFAARSDDGAASLVILREIVKRMCEAGYLVFDLTDERPNVYFELGYAFGIGNHAENVLLIAKTGSKIHFDVAPLRVQYFESDDALRSVLATQLGRLVSDSRRQSQDRPAGEARPWWKVWNGIRG